MLVPKQRQVFPGGVSLTPKLILKPSLLRQVLMRRDEFCTDSLQWDVYVFSRAQFLRDFFRNWQSWMTLDKEDENRMTVDSWEFLEEKYVTYVSCLGVITTNEPDVANLESLSSIFIT